jgi:uncharacterized protein
LGGPVDRRDFLKLAPLAAYGVASAHTTSDQPSVRGVSRVRIESFDYRGVRLRASPWQRQYASAREFYASLPEDDILHGYRMQTGLPAPGKPLGGWCGRNSDTVFGQWLSGMSRMACATGDADIRDKAVRLFSEWSRTVQPNGDCGMRHYAFDKLVCGLVDLQRYADHEPAIAVLEKVTAFATREFSRENELADPTHNQGYYGRPQEWYTLAENLYRAYQLTGNPAFRSFAEAWLYPAYWNKFAATSSPTDAHGVHAYSHVNTFSSAAMAYEIGGDALLLRIVRNAYDYLQQHQCFATGGYGPNERFMAPQGSLGRALDTRSDTFETVCGSWAGFKLARYLMRFTGDASSGDWIERLLYNGVGAALPIAQGGRNFYYADYRVGGGMKVYNWETFTCCSGTYIQNVADYHNLIYFRSPAEAADPALYVNLYLPSEVTWERPGRSVTLVQDTSYPDGETSTITIQKAERPTAFALRFRVPAWAHDASLTVNGTPADVACKPGTWATITRTWNAGDRVEIRIPLRFRFEPVDRQHPDRVAVVRGPVVMALEGAYHDRFFRLPERPDDLDRWLVPEDWRPASGVHGTVAEERILARPTVFRVVPPDKTPVRLKFRPFYEVAEGYPYFMYFDRKALPWRLW